MGVSTLINCSGIYILLHWKQMPPVVSPIERVIQTMQLSLDKGV